MILIFRIHQIKSNDTKKKNSERVVKESLNSERTRKKEIKTVATLSIDSRSISGAVVLTTGATTEEDSTENRENDELHCLSFRAFYYTTIVEFVTVVPRAGFEPALQRF